MSLTWHVAVILIKILKRSDHAKKRCLKRFFRFFCGDICTKNAVKCRTVFFPRSLALANRRHFGETSKVRIGKSSLRIPENMCVHVWKKMQPSSANNSYLIWYIHLCMYFLVYIHSLVSCFMNTFFYLVSLFSYPWLYFWILFIMWRVSKFASPNSRLVSDPPKFHQWSTALWVVLCLQSSDSSPRK